MLNDSKERYGSVSKWLHWLMAGLILWQFLKFFDRINDGEHWVGETLVRWHVSIGSVLLVLVVMRIFWALSQLSHRPAHDPATALAVKAGHLALYLGMALLPITGVLTMIGNGYGMKVFGIQLVARGAEIPWVASVGSLHSPLAWLTLLLVIGHVGMALLHHFKGEDVLRRML